MKYHRFVVTVFYPVPYIIWCRIRFVPLHSSVTQVIAYEHRLLSFQWIFSLCSPASASSFHSYVRGNESIGRCAAETMLKEKKIETRIHFEVCLLVGNVVYFAAHGFSTTDDFGTGFNVDAMHWSVFLKLNYLFCLLFSHSSSLPIPSPTRFDLHSSR